jgi:hypothetical protein
VISLPGAPPPSSFSLSLKNNTVVAKDLLISDAVPISGADFTSWQLTTSSGDQKFRHVLSLPRTIQKHNLNKSTGLGTRTGDIDSVPDGYGGARLFFFFCFFFFSNRIPFSDRINPYPALHRSLNVISNCPFIPRHRYFYMYNHRTATAAT